MYVFVDLYVQHYNQLKTKLLLTKEIVQFAIVSVVHLNFSQDNKLDHLMDLKKHFLTIVLPQQFACHVSFAKTLVKSTKDPKNN
ncbi:hypothetical protein M0813_13344 [Anaeramoeba flamelloides]|uniref:Uncharacterized protein n=1 Tax=Anaeramoeba flamelloides TaxID=1746091 RepID=A0AAV7YA63_9EUKA|nr:hypothetical protein M0812_27182 [Anaeramoeba flamelloides]KAJ6253470.1 hypothetical protein M0813_13344 [Anaeramoeba flamelloides]